MPPRQSDPRRGSRGGVTDSSLDPTVTPLRGGADPPLRGGADRGGQGRPGIGDARRYTPRGRSIREADAECGQRSRGGDPFRPALEVVQGDDEPSRRSGRGGPARGADPPPRARSARTRTGPSASEQPSPGRTPATPAEGRPATRATGRSAKPSAGRTATKTGGRAANPPGGRAATGRSGGPATATRGARAGSASRARAAASTAPGRRAARKPKRQVRLPDPRRRLRLATVFILVLFVTIGGRLVELQLIDARGYAAKGLLNRVQTIPLAAPRGTIYDRDRNVLAHSVDARYVYGDPGLVQDPEQEARQLAPLLGTPASELVPKLRRHNYENGTLVRFEYLARGIDVSVADQVRALNLKGIGVDADERRDVPGHDLASNLLGYTGYELTGVAGLESSYNDLLRGVAGKRTFEIGGGDVAAEIPSGYHLEEPAKPGSSLQLTINRDLQFQVQYLLSQQMQKVRADFGTAVVIEVASGEVLAQASYPSYDAAEPSKTPASQRGDANTNLVVDPGSVAKVITLAAALQEGVLKPDSTVTVGPTVRKGDTTYSDTHPFPTGTRLTLPGILAYSSNVATIGVADQLGAQRLYDYQRRFGLGAVTGEGLPGESPGLIQPPANWSGSSYGSIPIGNGMSVTPLQMTEIYATIANHGVWVRPHLVKNVIRPDGTTVAPPAAKTRRVLSPAVADQLRQMLEAVVTVDGATGHRAAVPGYRVAGKTGTGKFVGPNGKYVTGDVGSFIGMAPADAPRYVIGVFAHSPGGEGGDVSAPAFSQMMAFALGQNQVPPTGTTVPPFRTTG